MPQEIIEWCDPCYAADERTAGVAVNIGLRVDATGVPPVRTLLLCSRHVDELLKPLEHLLDEYGAAIEIAPPRQSRQPGQSGQRPRVLAASKGPVVEKTLLDFAQNGSRKGQQPAGERLFECLWCPLTYASGSGLKGHLKPAHGLDGLVDAFGGPCPICGRGPFGQPMNHCNLTHPEYGFTAVSQPFTWARDNGDPHGVYAATLEKAQVHRG